MQPTIHRTIDRARAGGMLYMSCSSVDQPDRKDGSAGKDDEGHNTDYSKSFETRREGGCRSGRCSTAERGVAQCPWEWQVQDHAKQVRPKLCNQLHIAGEYPPTVSGRLT
jgi:hypothetical protein